MKVTAIKDFSKSITKGNQYKVVTEKQLTFVVVDDEGFYLGLSKEYFEVNKEQTALQQHIEWLKDTVEISKEHAPILVNVINLCIKDAESRLELEKQQIIETYNKGREAGVGDYIDIEWGRNATELTAEQYYNETFKP